jgi:zinc finger protein 830
MADVRALLRNERLSRRIEHPQASYSTSGVLNCKVCKLSLKADSLWEPHINGKTHRQNLLALTQAAPQNLSSAAHSNGKKRKAEPDDDDNAAGEGQMGKKRKADDDAGNREASIVGGVALAESEDISLRRKAKPVSRMSSSLPSGFFDGRTNEDALALVEEEGERQQEEEQQDGNEAGKGPTSGLLPAGFFDSSSTKLPNNTAKTTTMTINSTKPSVSTEPITTTTSDKSIDEDEWASFEREISHQQQTITKTASQNALTSGPDIAAAPQTAAELAAAAETGRDAVQERGRKDEEIDAEKEDAARALEEEFDEMEQLEQRVKRLREMREKLRLERVRDSGESENVQDMENDDEQQEEEGIGGRGVGDLEGKEDEDEEEDDDDDDDVYDDFESWGRR